MYVTNSGCKEAAAEGTGAAEGQVVENALLGKTASLSSPLRFLAFRRFKRTSSRGWLGWLR
jgi:hypothetical protein